MIDTQCSVPSMNIVAHHIETAPIEIDSKASTITVKSAPEIKSDNSQCTPIGEKSIAVGQTDYSIESGKLSIGGTQVGDQKISDLDAGQTK